MRLTTTVARNRSEKAALQREPKVYRLRSQIPATLRKPSAGRAVLESIRRHRRATANTIRKDMKRGFSDATLRFYLGKFQRERIVR